ncbi:hypothetical protein [Companilactobacillus kedongensis]|uniref:hypothetical protein n=1 Tax=Companilactobacillus kedongensis TaxID=2486004 RepID=UPI000F772E0C|nr:hypothetical protein [Companilactobacillus kedongensis]
MKKSIKYAGIIATSFLMTVPLASPEINSLNVVKADDVAPDTDDNRVNEIAKELQENLKDQSFVTGSMSSEDMELMYTAISNGYDFGNQMSADTKGSSLISYGVNDEHRLPMFQGRHLLSEDSINYLKNNGVYYQIRITDPYIDDFKSQFDSLLHNKSDNSFKSFKASVKIIYFNLDSDGNPVEKLIDVSPEVTAINNISEITSANINYPSSISVSDGTAVSSVQDSSKIYTTLTDTSGEGTFSNGTVLGKSIDDRSDNILYKDLESAKNALGTGSTDGQVQIGDTFSHSQGSTYYRIVKVGMTPLATEYLKGSGKVTINNEPKTAENITSDGAIQYIQKIVVEPRPSTVDRTTGVATTHNDKTSYDLYNDDNKKVDNRALAASSSWKVDKARTVNGVKQYRVSTHEWVNESDVDFVSNGNISEGMTVKRLSNPQKISLSTDHDIYNIQNSKQEVSTTRALAGGTNWLVDKVGTDSHGGIYYGVSTDEFVKASDGVRLVK